jgi:TolA-binding protein
MFRPISLLNVAVILGLSACVTSGDLASGRESGDNYEDPTEVQTLDAAPTSDSATTTAEKTTPAPRVAPSNPRSEEAAPVVGNVDSLRRENAVLSGQVEESRFRVTQLESENAKLKEELEKAKTAVPPPAAVVPPALANTGESAGRTGAPLLWELARKDIAANRFKEALTPLEEILKSYPDDDHVPLATLALGMAHYNLEQYKEAALAFNKVIDRHPKTSGAAIAWFGQGACFFKLNQKDDSKLFYQEVLRRFPKSPAAKQASKWLEKKKGGAPGNLFAAFPDWAGKA